MLWRNANDGRGALDVRYHYRWRWDWRTSNSDPAGAEHASCSGYRHSGGRSTVAKSYRNILGFEDGVSGESLRRKGREQAAKYGAVFFADEVVKLESQGKAGFLVHMRNAVQPLECRTLVMATGIKDPFPAIPGIEECLGTSIFLCPDCDGYETLEQRTAVIELSPVQSRWQTSSLSIPRKFISLIMSRYPCSQS